MAPNYGLTSASRHPRRADVSVLHTLLEVEHHFVFINACSPARFDERETRHIWSFAFPNGRAEFKPKFLSQVRSQGSVVFTFFSPISFLLALSHDSLSNPLQDVKVLLVPRLKSLLLWRIPVKCDKIRLKTTNSRRTRFVLGGKFSQIRKPGKRKNVEQSERRALRRQIKQSNARKSSRPNRVGMVS